MTLFLNTLYSFAISAMVATAPAVSDKPSYSFDQSMEVKMDSYKKNGKLDDSNSFSVYTNSIQDYKFFGMELQQDGVNSFIIFDQTLEKVITLVDVGSMKTAIAVKIKDRKSSNSKNDENPPEYKKTGQTKVINGYTCDEYMAEEDGNKNYFYSSKEAKNGLFDFFIDMYNTQNKANFSASELHKDPVLQISNIDEKGRRYDMTIVDFKENINKTLKLSDYKTMGIN